MLRRRSKNVKYCFANEDILYIYIIRQTQKNPLRICDLIGNES